MPAFKSAPGRACAVLLLLFFFTPTLVRANCRNLEKVNSLEELLGQFYNNLGSDCLYLMPVEKLESALGISIFAIDELRKKWEKPGNEGEFGAYLNQLEASARFRGKPYKEMKDLFYVSREHRGNVFGYTFSIVLTDEAQKRFGTLFPDGKLASILPKPSAVEHGTYHKEEPVPSAGETDRFMKDSRYYWRATKKNNYDGVMFMYAGKRFAYYHLAAQNILSLFSGLIE